MKGLYALVGLKFRPEEARRHFAALPNGSPLVLKREPTNPHDRNAVQVWSGDVMIGYVSGKQNAPLAMAMDRQVAGAIPDASPSVGCFPAKLAIDGGKWPLIEVEE